MLHTHYSRMYPHHHLSYVNVPSTLYSQQPYPNPLFFSLPQQSFPSDSALYPPVGNSSLCHSTPAADAARDSQNWIVKQAAPIKFDLAARSSHETSTVSASLPSAGNGTVSHQVFAKDTTIILPNQTKVSKGMRCEVCKIDCNSKDVYEKHISGKKHKKKLQEQTNPINTMLSGPSDARVQSQTSSIPGQGLVAPVGKELESKKQKLLNGGAAVDLVKVCTICNIVCNSQEVFNKHLYGKTHAAQVALISRNGIGPYLAAFKRQGIGPWKMVPKKIKATQPAWCDVCKINCNSRDVYIVHLSGKKHLKNLEKLSKPKDDAGASTANASQRSGNPIIGPQEKPTQKTPEMDIEAKKRKVIEGGAAAALVRFCTLCNVVCNSQIVFDIHLSGQKHAAMVKKQAEARGTTAG